MCSGASSAILALPRLLELLVLRNIAGSINLLLTQNARKFISAASLRALPRMQVISSLAELIEEGGRRHTEIARASAVAVVVPATGNLIGKLANGIIDDDVTTILSVYERPLLVFPAIHPVTAQKKFFLRNIDQLRNDGNIVVGPVKGYSMTDGAYYDSVGPMPEPEKIAMLIEYAVRSGVDRLNDIVRNQVSLETYG